MSALGADIQALLLSDLCKTFPCVMAVTPQNIGTTTIGATIDSSDSNYLNGSQVETSTLGGQAVTLSVYIKGPLDVAARRAFQVGLYSDVNGFPGQLLGVSVVGTLVANSWNTLVVAGTRLQPLTKYWVMASNAGAGSGVNRMVYEMAAGGVGAWSVAPVPFGTWPQTFPATVTGTNFSLYATVLP